MQLRFQKVLSLATRLLFLLLVASIVSAQEKKTVKKRLRSPAVVKGFIAANRMIATSFMRAVAAI